MTTAGFPWFIRYPAKLALPFIATDPRIVAEEIVYMCTNDGWVLSNGVSSVSREGRNVARGMFVHPGLEVRRGAAQLEDEEVCEEVVERTLGILRGAGWEGKGEVKVEE
ncbi:hypothetical protein HDU67_008043 [Dinochytrium kinnereticum]|nr:hypothetical protein HDU67_008043 [Dinochytrium kinnereticum]